MPKFLSQILKLSCPPKRERRGCALSAGRLREDAGHSIVAVPVPPAAPRVLCGDLFMVFVVHAVSFNLPSLIDAARTTEHAATVVCAYGLRLCEASMHAGLLS